MADICPMCGEKFGFSIDKVKIQGEFVHGRCRKAFKDPDGRKGIERQKRIEEKSVYVKGFSMPFGEMVELMVKWALASIPAFIILFIIFGIFFAMFTAIFVSTV